MKLIDLNVWVALVNGQHVHHAQVAQFWQQESGPFAFCRVTQLGFLRLTTNKLVMGGEPLTPHQAWAAYDELLASGPVAFCAESQAVDAQFRRYTKQAKLSPGDWTDAYLAAFAVTSDCTLVSLDDGFKRFAGLRFECLA
jgi:toxin-antitoxin system PIN domain toxin